MKRPSPIIITLLLLASVFRLAEQPTTKAVMLGALIATVAGAVGRVLVGSRPMRRLVARRRAGPPARLAPIPLVLITLASLAFGAMLATQPRLRATYLPDQFATAPEIDSRRGFHASEVDAAGNRYAWTQERATLVFNFLVRKPITLTFAVRSAAVAGGPDKPVQVLVNGEQVGELRPDPTNLAFQAIGLRLTPRDWGGQQTEVRLVPTSFKPQGDSRILGTMVQSVSVDKREAWATVSRRSWVLWLMPVLSALALGCTGATRRYRSPALPYGAAALLLAGMVCATALLALVLRIGPIEESTYLVWVLGSACIALCFAAGAVAALAGRLAVRGIARRLRARVASHGTIPRIRAMRWRIMRPSPAEPASARPAIMRDLLVVFLVALGVRLIWAVVVPPWQAPDEPDHFIYTAHVVEQKEIPHPPYPNYPYYPPEDVRSWELTLLGEISSVGASPNHALPYLPVARDYAAARDYRAPEADRRSDSGARASSYPPLYYLYGALPYRLFQGSPIIARLFAVRCGSALLGAFSCVFGYLLAYEIRRTRRWGTALGLCMALLPMYVFATATVNNDAAMNLCATAVIWLTVRTYRRRDFPPALALALGVTSGLALLAKPTAAPVVAVAGMVVLIKAFPPPRAPWRVMRAKLLACGAWAAGAGAAYGPWALVRLHYYGDVGFGWAPLAPLIRLLTGGIAVAATSPVSPDGRAFFPSSRVSVAAISLWQFLHLAKDRGWAHYQSLLITGFWGNFGWLDAPLPERVFVPIVVVYIIGGIGMAMQLVLQPKRRGALVLLLGYLLAQSLFLFIGVDYYEGYVRTGAEVGLQGRYFFPILAPLLFLLLSGWDHLCQENSLVLRLAPLGMAWLQVIALATLLLRYYGVALG